MYGAVAESTNKSCRSSPTDRTTKPAHNVPAQPRRKPAAGARTRTSPRLGRAVRFLAHPTVVNLPHEDKLSYLRGKGLTPREVEEALDLVGFQEENENEINEMDGAWDDGDGGNDGGFDEYARQGRGPAPAGRRRQRAQQPNHQFLDNQSMQPYQQPYQQEPHQHQQQAALAEPPGLAPP